VCDQDECETGERVFGEHTEGHRHRDVELHQVDQTALTGKD
jgi:hypothetical protein